MASPNDHSQSTEDKQEEASKKRSNGRRKIPIQVIEDRTRKHVTFSKRRAGLFKKASELCALCGVEMAILTFSERGKLFCFGHPDPDDVVRRYISGGALDDEDDEVTCNELASMVEEHNRRYEEIKRKIEEEKKFADYYQIRQGHNWNNNGHNNSHGFWWDEAHVDGMGLDELEQFMNCLLELRNNVAKQVDKLTGANMSFSTNQMGDGIVDYGNADLNDSVNNLGCANTPYGFSNNPVGMLNNNHSDPIMVMEDAKIDIIAHQSYRLGFMSEMNLEDQIAGKEFNQFSSISQGVELLNLNVMNHRHQVSAMEDQGSSLTNQDSLLKR
ncbi:hypothetical protein Cgig2_029460 [Carnegiea gigantea]|uniref:MADS-box domain-containing protein n=1 Tax=Carnegiea gigantea TaxID=171969 RepID=A0A9Q1KKL9_9CARY|nr:hypothetical protein Cgig2_029460 [Carnegiea gigantea]